MLELLLDISPAVVSFHFGLPERETIQRLRQQGIVTLATATSLQEALLIEQQGIDVVVAQGYEAGGHRGIFAPQAPDAQLSTFTLVQLLRRRLTIPVVAAGGIMDGAGIASVMQLGRRAYSSVRRFYCVRNRPPTPAIARRSTTALTGVRC
ncbi:enoyl-[acyl-carrier-protein] reductase [Klebsiella pneumoniae]|uniref:Propionate 3-nitronate monooxygenase n=1 Tax=Klebsiella pneumoniae TaxID=573 RepID=A0A377TXK1_KLEPN|nr:enoyl-[acyl-carrier-protein] reductase [Klebsiella pneumoniae]